MKSQFPNMGLTFHFWLTIWPFRYMSHGLSHDSSHMYMTHEHEHGHGHEPALIHEVLAYAQAVCLKD